VTGPEAQSFFDAYARAFTAKDVEAVADQWSFPCLITQQTGAFPFADRAAFTKNTSALQSFYDRQGVALALARVDKVNPLYEGVAAVTVYYTLSNSDAEPIAGWLTTYILRRGKDLVWRASYAVADGEITAWAERGTPLGAKH
jgi:hypothetical protein